MPPCPHLRRRAPVSSPCSRRRYVEYVSIKTVKLQRSSVATPLTTRPDRDARDVLWWRVGRCEVESHGEAPATRSLQKVLHHVSVGLTIPDPWSRYCLGLCTDPSVSGCFTASLECYSFSVSNKSVLMISNVYPQTYHPARRSSR